jgi:hypothetical protein
LSDWLVYPRLRRIMQESEWARNARLRRHLDIAAQADAACALAGRARTIRQAEERIAAAVAAEVAAIEREFGGKAASQAATQMAQAAISTLPRTPGQRRSSSLLIKRSGS